VSLDPLVEYDSATFGVTQNVYETLIYYYGDDTTKLKPVLATAWSSSPDAKVWTFYLRSGVKFQDGSDFNASAVKYSWDRGVLINSEQGAYFGLLTPYLLGGQAWMDSNHTQADANAYLAKKTVNVINDTAVQVTLENPMSDFPYVVTFPGMAIVSPSFDIAHGGYTLNNYSSSYLREHASGTGPFTVASWTRDDNLVLQRNDNYWGDKALPYKIVRRVVPDYNTRLTALRSGDADMIYVPLKYHRDIANVTEAQEFIGPALQVNFLGFQQNKWPSSDIRFRQAVSESFDAATFNNNVSFGLGKIGNGEIPAGLPGYNANITGPAFNTTHAKQLLQDMGFNKNNKTTVVVAFNSENSGRQTAALMLKQQIESYDLGVTVDVQGYEWTTYLDKQRNGDFNVFVLGWTADYPSAMDFVGPFSPPSGFYANQVKFTNATVSNAYTKALTASPAELQSLLDQMVIGANSDYAYDCYQFPIYYQVLSKNVKGFTHNPLDSETIYTTLYK
jgi:peptide/nickel transport system substrate-binding protein